MLIRELSKRIASFKPHTLDINLAVFAKKDLETYLGVRWGLENRTKVQTRLELYLSRQPEDTKIFLGYWVDRWLEKWKERVKILYKKQKVTTSHRERIRKVKIVYTKLDQRKKLKRMVIRKLVNQGEICMTDLIAENLIIREVARRLQTGGTSTQIKLNPMEILNSLSSKIIRLPEEKGPIVYLRVRTRVRYTAS